MNTTGSIGWNSPRILTFHSLNGPASGPPQTSSFPQHKHFHPCRFQRHDSEIHTYSTKGIFIMANIDITPVTNPILGGGSQPNGIHFHGPSGVSACSINNPSDPFASMPAVKPGVVAVKVNSAASQVSGSQI